MSPRLRWTIAIVLVLAAFAVRAVQIETTRYAPIYDAGSYLKLASEVAHTGDYSNATGPGTGAGGSQGPSAYFPPGFSYLLAAVDRITGHTEPAGPSVQPARYADAVLGTATVAFIGLIAYELAGWTVALVALALAAVYPVLIELSAVVVAENLATPLLLASVWTVLRARRSEARYPWIAGAGFLLGLAALAHENAAILLIPLAIGVWPRKRTIWPPFLDVVVLVLACAVTIAPWTIRNAVVLHRFIPVSDETGITLRGTYNPNSAAYFVPYKWRIFYGIPQDRDVVRAARMLTEPELGDRLQSRALAYIGDHPLSPIVVAFDNTRRLLELEGSFPWHASAYAQGLPTGVAGVGVVSFWLLAVVALLGAFTASARAGPRWLWAVPVLLWLSAVFVNAETPRFREPVDPFLVILAACAVVTAAEWVTRTWRPATPSTSPA